jgi:hypothetical protein
MASKARAEFEASKGDVQSLLDFHKEKSGTKAGRRSKRLEVLNKSAIVRITALWEAYCEDMAAEALEHIVNHTVDASKLSNDIRKLIAKELKSDSHDLAIWKISGDGWKAYLKARFRHMREERNRKLNTPKTKKIEDLFEQSIGLNGLSRTWKWRRMSPDQAANKLDRFITLRGSIAHRGVGPSTCKKSQVTAYLNHVSRIVERIDINVSAFVHTMSGKQLRQWIIP